MAGYPGKNSDRSKQSKLIQYEGAHKGTLRNILVDRNVQCR